MSTFNIDNIKSPLKDVYKTHLKWVDTNWRETLEKHNKELSKLLEKAGIFDIWSINLHDDKAANSLIPEIFMDAFMSFHFACMGLYKYANVCLRSELETALRLVYFATHPIEFEWWCEGNEWYLGKNKDVWGEGYRYFDQLKPIKEFNKNIPPNKNLVKKIRNIYSLLSQYVHSGISAFQTSLKISPKYNIKNFKNWVKNYKEIQQYVNIVITLGFRAKFKRMRKNDQKKILKIGLYNKVYKKRFNEIFGLKI